MVMISTSNDGPLEQDHMTCSSFRSVMMDIPSFEIGVCVNARSAALVIEGQREHQVTFITVAEPIG